MLAGIRVVGRMGPPKGKNAVHLRPLRSLAALCFASTLFLGLTQTAYAGPKDKDAQKLFDKAINEDYLNADFDKAEKKLKEAVTKCGSSGCSPELLGKIYVALGTVHGVGQNKSDDAKSDFVSALKADPSAALDPALTTPELTKLFADAKKSAGNGSSSGSSSGSSTPKPPAGDSNFTPPPESQVNTPLPIYVEPPDDVPLSKVVLRYKPFGATQFKSVELRKTGKGYGGEIPCTDTTTTGDIKYFFAFTGTDGEPAGELGSSKEPFKTTIKNDLDGAPPHLPGKKAPAQCHDTGDCPPDMPGCDSGHAAKHGDKGWGSTCEASSECKEGLVCLNGDCEEDNGSGGGSKKDSGSGKKMNLMGVGIQFDWLILSGQQGVCDGPTNYACYIQGTNNQFFGVPVPFTNTDGIQGGGSFAGARILLGYDRQLLKKVGLSLGLRVGYAFGGPKSPDNVDSNGTPIDSNGNPIQFTGAVAQRNGGADPQQTPAKSFLPVHAELRLSYYLLGSMMEEDEAPPVRLRQRRLRPGQRVGAGRALRRQRRLTRGQRGQGLRHLGDADRDPPGQRVPNHRPHLRRLRRRHHVRLHPQLRRQRGAQGGVHVPHVRHGHLAGPRPRLRLLIPGARTPSPARRPPRHPDSLAAPGAGSQLRPCAVASGRPWTPWVRPHPSARLRPSGGRRPLFRPAPCFTPTGWSTTISRRRCSSSRRAAHGSPRAESPCGSRSIPPARARCSTG